MSGTDTVIVTSCGSIAHVDVTYTAKVTASSLISPSDSSLPSLVVACIKRSSRSGPVCAIREHVRTDYAWPTLAQRVRLADAPIFNDAKDHIVNFANTATYLPPSGRRKAVNVWDEANDAEVSLLKLVESIGESLVYGLGNFR